MQQMQTQMQPMAYPPGTTVQDVTIASPDITMMEGNAGIVLCRFANMEAPVWFNAITPSMKVVGTVVKAAIYMESGMYRGILAA